MKLRLAYSICLTTIVVKSLQRAKQFHLHIKNKILKKNPKKPMTAKLKILLEKQACPTNIYLKTPELFSDQICHPASAIQQIENNLFSFQLTTPPR